MDRRTSYAAAVGVVALLAVTGFVAPTVGGALGMAALTGGTAPGDSTPTAGQAGQQSGGACNYTALYRETIDSVVTVKRGGGQGSGFVYQPGGNDSSNYVVTNAHVVGEASNVTVQFSRGDSANGTVLGTDISSDLAVIETAEMPDYAEALPLTDGNLQHGQRVAALGSPFGLEETITHGIISGLDRAMPTRRGYVIPNVVQTDAPISSGNSGGPLVTCEGAVVGVNTAGIAAQGAENIGFAVSASMVERVVPALVETGEFEHPTLGVRATTVTPVIERANDLDVDRGVFVVEVSEWAPAAEVLRGSNRTVRVDGRAVPVGGDVIVAVEGRSVATAEELASVLLEETRPGDEVTLTIVRDGTRQNVTTTVTERPDPGTASAPGQ